MTIQNDMMGEPAKFVAVKTISDLPTLPLGMRTANARGKDNVARLGTTALATSNASIWYMISCSLAIANGISSSDAFIEADSGEKRGLNTMQPIFDEFSIKHFHTSGIYTGTSSLPASNSLARLYTLVI